MCLNHPALVQKHPTHLASSVMVRTLACRSTVFQPTTGLFSHPTVSYLGKEWLLGELVSDRLTLVALSRPSQKAITVQLQPASSSETVFFKYDRVHYDPRTVEEAKKCLQHFFCEVRSVIGQLHDTYKLAHMDIRLDNICFNQQFKPLLIDLDRSEGLGTDLGEESA